MKFSLDDEAVKEISQFFDEAIEAACETTNTMFDDLTDIYKTEAYKPLYTLVSNAVNNYQAEFKAEVLKQFDIWASGGSSVVKFAEMVKASDEDSDESSMGANNLQNNMRDILESRLGVQISVDSISEAVHLTKELSDTFDEINDRLKELNSNLDDNKSDFTGKADNNADDNQVYANVKVIISYIYEAYKSFFERVEQDAEKVGSSLDNRGASAESTAESDVDTFENYASAAGDQLKDISGLFEF